MYKQAFVAALADYLVTDQARKSILLEMGKPEAKQWAALRATTPLQGYPTLEEAKAQLTAWLGIPA